MNGESCTDGYTCITTCTDCGYSYQDYSTSHNTYLIFDISDLENGTYCEGHHIEIYSCPCGLEFDVNWWDIDYSDEKDAYYCKECGLGFSETVDYAIEGCTRTETRTVAVTLGEEELYYTQIVNSYSNHNFDGACVSVVDGDIVLTMSCTSCGTIGDQTVQTLPAQRNEYGEFYYELDTFPGYVAGVATRSKESPGIVRKYSLEEMI
jgi:transposase-like protein